MIKKFIFIIVLLFCIGINVEADFPNSISDLRHTDYCNCDSNMSCNKVCYQGPSTLHLIMKFAKRVDQINQNNTNSIMYYTGPKENKTYPNEDIEAGLILMCTNFYYVSPVPATTGDITRKTNDRCTKITSTTANGYWSDPVKAGVATIIKKMLDGSSAVYARQYANQPKYFAYYDTDASNNYDYYDASTTITKFTSAKGVKGVDVINTYNSTWLESANTEYNKVNNMNVSIDGVQTNNDDNAFYVKVNVTTAGGSSRVDINFYDKSGSPITATLQTWGTYRGYYKILKSSLNEGNNDIEVQATSSYTTFIAENYDCGVCKGGNGCTYGARLQTISPSYIETKTFYKYDEYTFNLTKQSRGNLTINIINDTTENLITTVNAKFTIHEGTGCTGKKVDEKSTILGTTGKINLPAGTYSIKEVEPRISSSDYLRVSSTDCVVNSTTIPAGGNTTEEIRYIPQCSVKLTDIKDQYELGSDSYIRGLLDLYKEYPSNTKLLNFSDPHCSAATNCSNDLRLGCLSASINSTFSENDLSCFDEKKDVNGKTVFCKTSYNLANNIGVNEFYSKSGRLLIEKSGNIIKIFEKNSLDELVEKQIITQYIATANTTKTCYVLGNVSMDFDLDTYTVSFGDNNDDGNADMLPFDSYTHQSMEENVKYGFVKHSLTNEKNYKLNEIYLEKITGKYSSTLNSNTTDAVYGVLTKFNSSNGSILFKVNDVSSNACRYYLDKEIIKYKNDNGKLDLEFRTIDTNTPFNRNTMSNWSYGTDNSKYNQTVQENIIDATNSYGIKNGVPNQLPKYTINLTPEIINEIREYNKINAYDEFYELCNEDSCESKSKFLNDLYKEGVIE